MRHLTILLLALISGAPALLNAQPQCGLNTLRGSYAFYYTSGVPGTPPFGIGVGVVSFDGAGKGTSKETVSINPMGILKAESAVKYTVNADCTGTITWTYPPELGNLVVRGNIVIADVVGPSARTIYTIGTDAGSMSYGVYTRQ